ncbi:hypothetical protein BZA05DRAFT_416269 [Tricharina praecox]|uniref:uncharacterized protein n=1 Tax=Tricharina praecox TaxID=43433 RepID=UPI00221EF2AB|nr:uncharacterized protein BZA05DRAFT_416269 [Tricharina praecox]KAI5856616.1 hypothetical protein BZA05DRAFT_416269 [Tricharina praecox]
MCFSFSIFSLLTSRPPADLERGISPPSSPDLEPTVYTPINRDFDPFENTDVDFISRTPLHDAPVLHSGLPRGVRSRTLLDHRRRMRLKEQRRNGQPEWQGGGSDVKGKGKANAANFGIPRIEITMYDNVMAESSKAAENRLITTLEDIFENKFHVSDRPNIENAQPESSNRSETLKALHVDHIENPQQESSNKSTTAKENVYPDTDTGFISTRSYP